MQAKAAARMEDARKPTLLLRVLRDEVVDESLYQPHRSNGCRTVASAVHGGALSKLTDLPEIAKTL